MMLALPALPLFLAACGTGGSERAAGGRPAGAKADTGEDAPRVVHVATWEHERMRGPLRIAIGPDGTVYASDPVAGGVHVLSAAGDYAHTLATIARPLGLAVDRSGNLVVGDGEFGRVVILSPHGELLSEFGAGEGEFSTPQDIAVDSDDGAIWVLDSANHAVVRCAADGTILWSMGAAGSGDGEFLYPTGIALDSDKGEVYVSDSNNGRVQVFDEDGNYLREVGSYGGSDGQLARTQGIAFDTLGRLYVADVYQNQVVTFASGGNFVSWVGSMGTEPGELYLPSDLVVDPWDRLLVTSHETGRIEVFGLGDYGDPVVPLPAWAAIEPAVLTGFGASPFASVYLDVASTDAAIEADSVLVAGSVAPIDAILSDLVFSGDHYEARLTLSAPALVEALGSEGTHQVIVTGALDDGVEFSGTFSVRVVP